MTDNPDQQHVDRNVTFTQSSSKAWEVIDSDTGTVVGHVQNSDGIWTSYNQNDTAIGEHESAEAGMFSIVSTPSLKGEGGSN